MCTRILETFVSIWRSKLQVVSGLSPKDSRVPRVYYYNFMNLSIFGAPEEIRTPDLWYRKPTLYPAELRAHIHILDVRSG